jgi:hypothetical protein
MMRFAPFLAVARAVWLPGTSCVARVSETIGGALGMRSLESPPMKPLLLTLPAAAVVIALGCGSSDDSPTGCAGLAACCATLSGAVAETCQEEITASGSSDSACQDVLSELENTGMCAGAGNGGATGCAALSACCPNLPVDQNPSECMEVASNGTVEACTESLSAYAAGGYCAGAGGGSINTFNTDASVGFGGPDVDIIGSDGSCVNGSTEEGGLCCLVMGNSTTCIRP